MKEESFQKIDEALMEKFKPLREKKIPEKVLEGFSASVEEGIRREHGAKSFRPDLMRIWARAWVPAFVALLVVFTWVAVQRFPSKTKTPAVAVHSVQSVLSTPAEISDEIVALRELGIWTEEDDESVNGSLEDLLSEVA